MINLEYGHRCRAKPVEAAIYSLKAKGEEHERFRAFATAEVTVELETKDQQEKKNEISTLELPVDFSREDVAKVKSLISIWTIKTITQKFFIITSF